MIGIIILNYINCEVTSRCISSILQNRPREDFHIYVIDNGSGNESVQVLNERFSGFPNITVHPQGRNVGFAAGNDFGIALCEKDHISECILSNSDIIFQRDSIDRIVEVLRNDPMAVIVGPKVEAGSAKGSEIHSSMLARRRFIDEIEIGRLFPVRRLDESAGSGVHQVFSVSGCCFGIRIENFRKMKAFDTNTFLYNEENILGIQAQRKGFRTYIDLDARVIHEHGASSGKDNDFIRIEFIKSALYYWKTYRNVSPAGLLLILYVYALKLRLFKSKGLDTGRIYREGRSYLKKLVSEP